jgi:hypothetical protein
MFPCRNTNNSFSNVSIRQYDWNHYTQQGPHSTKTGEKCSVFWWFSVCFERIWCQTKYSWEEMKRPYSRIYVCCTRNTFHSVFASMTRNLPPEFRCDSAHKLQDQLWWLWEVIFFTAVNNNMSILCSYVCSFHGYFLYFTVRVIDLQFKRKNIDLFHIRWFHFLNIQLGLCISEMAVSLKYWVIIWY